MSTPTQAFSAPGDPDEPLTRQYPPWTLDRDVYLPLGDWQIVLDVAADRDPAAGALLSRACGSADPDDPATIRLSGAELSSLIAFTGALADALEAGIDVTDRQLAAGVGDEYSSAAYARMVRAVGEVLREADRLGRPFEAWVE